MNGTDSGYMYVYGARTTDSVNSSAAAGDTATHGKVIGDEFNTMEEVREAIRKQGLDTCSLIFGLYISELW